MKKLKKEKKKAYRTEKKTSKNSLTNTKLKWGKLKYLILLAAGKQ